MQNSGRTLEMTCEQDLLLYRGQNGCLDVVSPASSDEGYETDVGFLKFLDDSSSTASKDTFQSTPFNLSHRLVIDQKIQHFSKWLLVLAHTSEDKEAGRIKARYINLPFLKSTMSKSRNTLQSNFYTRLQELNEGSSDGLAFGKALFCQKGNLKREHRSSEEKYFGPWDNELGNSGVLILHFVFIEKEFRRQGLARILFQNLIDDAKERTGKTGKGIVKFVTVFPAVVKQDFEELKGKTEAEKAVIKKIHYDTAVKFYRAVGFRRIGFSKWFGLALDPGHESHRVAIENDLDLPDSLSAVS
ncbi:hypothetical protein N431DRAFT_498779 [Stipitochalara longipes BDJ]|nr:hypothetical protein N431DRAFT_498779 [Stipitochalara longipes BDJ]